MNDDQSPVGVEELSVDNKPQSLMIIIALTIAVMLAAFWALTGRPMYSNIATTIPDIKLGVSKHELSARKVTDLVEGVEVYRMEHGTYPESLSMLRDGKYGTLINDPLFLPGDANTEFYYQKESERYYYLLGLGEDRQSFTADDILPRVPFSPEMWVGLIVKVDIP